MDIGNHDWFLNLKTVYFSIDFVIFAGLYDDYLYSFMNEVVLSSDNHT